jgi:hypothetical protein
MSITTKPVAALIGTALLAGPVGAASLQPDEAASKDVFVYAFEIPGTLGVPGVPAEINFDTPNVPDSAAAPFGATLGVAETTPFVNPDDPEFPDTVREHTTRSLLEFDVSSLGIAPEAVRSATFSVTGIGNLAPFAAPSQAFPITVDLKPVLQDWDEGAVTWNTRPDVGSVVQSTVMTDGFETLEFDVTDLVAGWLADPASNFGLELSQREVVQTDQPSMFTPTDLFAVGLFASSANPDVGARPSLEVAPIPLPASAALLLGGAGVLAGLGGMRRRAKA